MNDGEAIRWRLADDDAGAPSLLPSDAPEQGRRELPTIEYLHVRARRIVNQVPPASRMPFRYTVNVYRGCSHACTYCFARPTHEYLGMDAGEDFERRIVVKVNAPERLRMELAAPSWAGETIAMGTNTDPYQPAEGRYRLTRGVLEGLVEAANPFSILTKSTMVVRDADLLVEGARRTQVGIAFSIGTLDEEVWRLSEPGTPPPRRRLDALRQLRERGLPASVLVAPLLPGLSDGDEQIEAVVRACLDAGAESITPILLHLRPGVREVFMPWLERVRPDVLERYRELYRRAYAPEAERERITRLVADLTRGRTRRSFRIEGAPPPPRPAPVAQLSLLGTAGADVAPKRR
jgi:DNA repair photolyase